MEKESKVIKKDKTKKESAASLYLELLKKAILFEIWIEHEQNLCHPDNIVFAPKLENRQRGTDWPPIAHSMIGRERMENLHYCMNSVVKEKVKGDFIETGVWRGGACIFMRGFLKAYGIKSRKIWVADSFEGLPSPDPEYAADKDLNPNTINLNYLKVPLEQVKENFAKYDLLDDQVCFLEGWFRDTLTVAPIKKIAIARLDGDMYSSTWDSLMNLYDKISIGGYVIIDDYFLDPCRSAVHDFRDKFGIKEPIQDIDEIGVYWRKEKSL